MPSLQLAAMATPADVPALLGRLRGRSKVQQSVAARALSELAGSSIAGCNAIAAAAGTAALAQAVLNSGSSTAVQEHTCLALLEVLVCIAEERGAVAACGAIPRLVQLMTQPGQLGEAAAGVVCCMVAGRDCAAWREDVVAAGGVPALVSVLQNGTEGSRHTAALVLRHLSGDSSNQAAFLAAGAVPSLVELLVGGSGERQAAVLHALMSLTSEPMGAAAAVTAGAVPLLLQKLQISGAGTEALTVAAIVILRDMSGQTVSARHVLLEHPNAVPSLISLLSSVSGHDESNSSSSSSGGSSGGSGEGSSMSGNGVVQQCASGVLCNLATIGPQACASIVEAGAIPTLTRLLLTCADPDSFKICTDHSSLPGCFYALPPSTSGSRAAASPAAGSATLQQ